MHAASTYVLHLIILVSHCLGNQGLLLCLHRKKRDDSPVADKTNDICRPQLVHLFHGYCFMSRGAVHERDEIRGSDQMPEKMDLGHCLKQNYSFRMQALTLL